MYQARSAIDSGSSLRRPMPLALAVLLLSLGTAATAKPPANHAAPEKADLNRPVVPPPAATPVHGFTGNETAARADFVSRPVIHDAWRRSSDSLRAYPSTFSDVPNLHSREYLLDLSIPTLGGDGRGIRDQSPTEQFIRQARREGLPLARLWQNDQALLSLGLNRKGKPGLWIIQKTR